MRKQYMRWILPIIALLVIATVVVLSPLVSSHAQGNVTQPKPAVGTPTTVPSHSGAKPDWYFYGG